jgi:signal transduction histidine kinase
MADLMLDTRLDPEQANYARAIKTSGEALLTLIEEILDFSRIEAGKLTIAEEDRYARERQRRILEQPDRRPGHRHV